MLKTKTYIKLLFLAFLPAFGISLSAQTFPCDGSFYISLNNNFSPTTTYSIDYDGTTATFDNVMVTNLNVNGTGYNQEDNYIYAANRSNNQIIRLLSDGNFQVVGTEPKVLSWNTGAGDCSPEGLYAVHDRPSNTLYFYNVVGTFSAQASVELTWAPSSGNTGVADLDLDDIAFDPDDSKVIYTYQRNYSSPPEPAATRGALLKINGDPASAAFGQVEVIGIIPVNVIRHMGALFFDAFGGLYGYGSLVTNPVMQNRLIFIDRLTADATLITDGPSAAGNDGCSCPFSVSLHKTVESVSIGCDSTTVVYELTAFNNSKTELTGLTFTDQLPGGGRLIAVSPALPLGGTLAPGTGVGETSIVFNNASLGEKESITFELTMRIPSLVGSYLNQATLDGLPNSLNGQVLSDDPNTFSFEDPTVFRIDAEDLVPASLNEISAAICSGEVYTINNVDYNLPGNYTETIPDGAFNGCDSIIELTLDILPDVENPIAIEICTGTSYSINNVAYSTAGTHSEVVSNGAFNGCDSIIILDLSFSDTLYSEMALSLCSGETFELDGTLYTETGIYDIFYPGAALGGCDSLLTLDLFIENPLVYDLEIQPILCFGEITGAIQIANVQGGLPPYQYALDNGSFQENGLFQNLPSGTYSLTIQEANGCETVFDSLVVSDQSQELFLFADPSTFAVELGDEIELEAFANFFVDSLRWTPTEGLSCDDCLDPRLLPLQDGEYHLIAFDENGCVTDITFKVNVFKSTDIFMPNVFSPNGDGANDRITLFADNSVEEILEFRIYSRWGEEVFYRANFPPNDLSKGWDGTLKDEAMSPGVFAYYLKARCINGEFFFMKGDILLIK